MGEAAKMMREGIALAGALLCCFLLLPACLLRQSARFSVIPNDPSYLLQTPNSSRIPFNDVLRSFNDFEAGRGWIDLRPLMELRIENAYYKEGASRRGLAGYLGTEVARYAIAADGLELLSTIPMAGRPASDPAVQSLISDSEQRFRYYRLYYEIVFARSDHSHGSVLLGAGSTQELNELSEQLKSPESICYPAAQHCTVFPEACSVSVEMKVRVNGERQTVVWGTILGRLVKSPRHLLIKRLYNGRSTPIRLDFRDPRALLLPLLPGDEISWR